MPVPGHRIAGFGAFRVKGLGSRAMHEYSPVGRSASNLPPLNSNVNSNVLPCACDTRLVSV
eukprot:2155313-Rhodomonas_salina.3